MQENNLRVVIAKFCDYRPVKTRGVLQIICEVPAENSQDAMNRLGFPLPGKEIDVVIVRMNGLSGDQATAQSLAEQAEPPKAITALKPAASGTNGNGKIVQRAVLISKDKRFHRWASESMPDLWDGYFGTLADDERARKIILRLCKIESRSELAHDDMAGSEFLKLEDRFMRETGQRAEAR
ncbi:hypothetical protein UFOVP413_49 [uncultured Caudovirales phage]|uniref:Uncharacterized protein n=1 Tax=uncultured Caudovirales phage TaxID=2100421 RepID=A0A6J5M7M2_9CAUD|nr:hypothetical protein UFOVP413_49 [uncultured Caudovirales phage]